MRTLQQIRRIGGIHGILKAQRLTVEDAFAGNGNGALSWGVEDCVMHAPDTGKIIALDEARPDLVGRATAAIRKAESG